ncbi:sorbitol dehydrogenase [Xylariaceae sp. FL0804]|nr:sorbitol dehydrogenase [Xylariaceae sp. FL0804]
MSSTQVQTSVLHGPKDLRVEQSELPPPGPDEVQVAVAATGLCGSDLHYFSHFRNGNILVREPLTLGHESAGVVTAVGSNVNSSSSSSSQTPKFQLGDRVALEVGLPCEACALCRAGRYNICRGMQFGSSAKAFPHAQGTLRQRLNHPARWCHPLPAGVGLELGALAEPLSVAVHARRRAGLVSPSSSSSSSSFSGGRKEEGEEEEAKKEQRRVLVLGAGAVGLLCAAVCREAGARPVVVADINADRVRWAVDNGFADAGFTVPMGARPESIDDKLAYAQDFAAKIADVKVGSGDGATLGEVDVTFECTGVESCMHTAIYATQPGGKVMIIGMGTPIQTLPISAASLKEVDLVGVFRYANTYAEVLELLAGCRGGGARMPDVGKLVTQRFRGFDGIPRAFDMAGRVKDDQGNLVLKVVVDMSEEAGLKPSK